MKNEKQTWVQFGVDMLSFKHHQIFVNRILMESEFGVEIEIKDNNQLGGDDGTQEDSSLSTSPVASDLIYFHCTICNELTIGLTYEQENMTHIPLLDFQLESNRIDGAAGTILVLLKQFLVQLQLVEILPLFCITFSWVDTMSQLKNNSMDQKVLQLATNF